MANAAAFSRQVSGGDDFTLLPASSLGPVIGAEGQGGQAGTIEQGGDRICLPGATGSHRVRDFW